MQKSLADAYARGLLGKNIFGSGRDFDVYWHGGAGAYEVGEESALMESLEGKRGIPRIRPPFPAVVGLWGDRKSTRLNSSHLGISYAVFCLKKKKSRHARQGQKKRSEKSP